MAAQTGKAQHTPGPWEVVTVGSPKGIAWVREKATGDGIAQAIAPSNARLIAAAPALLEALRLTEAYLMHAGRCKVYGPTPKDCTCGITEVREQARVAIRLAEGEA